MRHYVPVMVKALFLGLLAVTMCGFARAAAAAAAVPPGQPVHHRLLHRELSSTSPPPPPAPPLEDPAARSERSTNLSHVTGSARKIQMFIKNRHLQLLPDGTVNGTTDDTSAYSESPYPLSKNSKNNDYCCRHLTSSPVSYNSEFSGTVRHPRPRARISSQQRRHVL